MHKGNLSRIDTMLENLRRRQHSQGQQFIDTRGMWDTYSMQEDELQWLLVKAKAEMEALQAGGAPKSRASSPNAIRPPRAGID